MITVIVNETENGLHYTFALLEQIDSVSELSKSLKRNLLQREKKMLKVWNAGTTLTANVYLAGNFAASMKFDL